MSYSPKVHYILEKDLDYEIKYETPPSSGISVGDTFGFPISDFEYNGKKYYAKYAITGGEIFYRGDNGAENGIYAESMVISESEYYSHWFVFCTDDENEITGDNYVTIQDIADEIFLSINTIDAEANTRGSESVISIDITNGAVGESFTSYGSTFSPTLSCDMFSCEFTERLIDEFYKDAKNGVFVNSWYTIKRFSMYPIPLGRFVVREEPTYTEETVSFNGIGLTEAYMEKAEIDIKSLNLFNEEEIVKKYVTSNLGFMDFANCDSSDVYFWEFLPEDFLRVTGCPLHIDNWSDIKNAIFDYKIPQLMIPALESFSKNPIMDDEGNVSGYEYEKEYTSRITWRELLSGIAILLRANVIEKNGAFYIKQLPDVKKSGYREIFNSSSYDNSAQFGKRLMCPSAISVKGNNWWFYDEKDQKYTYPVGFGYYTGEATVTMNSKKSNESNATHYQVTIECPWILFETMDRNPAYYKGQSMYLWLGHNENMQWQTALSRWNKAFTYHKANYQTIGWHPAMMAGEMNIVEDYDGEKKYVYIGEITIHYDGSVYADISSPCDVDIENTSSSGGYSSTAYSSNDKANQQGAQSQTSAEIKEAEKAIEDSATPGAYLANIPHFEFDRFNDKSMKVTLTEVTE